MADDPQHASSTPVLSGRIALVTGAAGDIGGAAAIRLSQAGAAVVAADHPGAADRLEANVAACLASRPDAVAHSLTFDITDAAATRDAIESAASAVGPPDLVFNNAGVQGAFAPTHRYPPDDAAAVVNVNVLGSLNVLTCAAATMVAGNTAGAIVNMASMAGVSGAPNMLAYSTSKAAILGMTKSAAKDLAPHNIRVNSVAPAFIGPGLMWERQVELQAAAGTQYFPSDPAVVAEMMINMVPMRRHGSVDEVIDVVLWLLSDQASYVTGVNIEISGGSA
jgi:NAD(P)-dependent dehydrogenase (short-subunit alcohol dehydrogenase family)